jgi:hypothetical protein
VLLAFINPSGPTREAQEPPALVSDIVLISAPKHTMEITAACVGAPAARDIQRRGHDVSSLTSEA